MSLMNISKNIVQKKHRKDNKDMTAEEIITRLRKEIDRMYQDYEGTPIIEEEDAMGGFEDIINDYYEDLSPM